MFLTNFFYFNKKKMSEAEETTEYVCADCGKTVRIPNKHTDSNQIKCNECGCVLLFKKRKETRLQILAR